MNRPLSSEPLSSGPLLIRPAQVEDGPLLVEILHAAFAEYDGQLDPPSGAHQESLESLLDKLAEGGAFLAYLGERPVGCVFFEIHAEWVYLGRLSVLPACRGQGVARALIERVEQQTRDLGRPAVQLGTRLALPHLVAYYQKLGYHIIQHVAHPGYSEPTYVIMEKTLNND